MARVVIENLTKIFPGARGKDICAVHNASLTIEDKEFLVLVGPSGCGKTTTLRMIAGLEGATSGTISIEDQILNDVHPKDRDIAMVFQNHALYPHMSAYDNLAFGLKLRRLSKTEIHRRITEAAAMLELSACLSRLPAALSGGERQRVALGRAIVRQPKVFLFDEPLSNLDAPMRLQLRAEIARLHQQLASTMIYVTHDQHEAMTLGDRIAVMRHGVIQQVGKPLELYRRPANLFVAGFIGSPPTNLFPGILLHEGNTCFFQQQSVEGQPQANSVRFRLAGEMTTGQQSYTGKRVVMGIRPEDIVEIGDPRMTSPGQTLEATIEFVEPTGPELHLHLASGGLRFVARARANLTARADQKISVAVQMDHALFFDAATEAAIA